MPLICTASCASIILIITPGTHTDERIVKVDGVLHPPELGLSDVQRRTIYALSTPPGKAGVGVVRISGPDALRIWERVVSRKIKPSNAQNLKLHKSGPEPWKMERCSIIHPDTSETLDDGLAVFFRGTLDRYVS